MILYRQSRILYIFWHWAWSFGHRKVDQIDIRCALIRIHFMIRMWYQNRKENILCPIRTVVMSKGPGSLSCQFLEVLWWKKTFPIQFWCHVVPQMILVVFFKQNYSVDMLICFQSHFRLYLWSWKLFFGQWYFYCDFILGNGMQKWGRKPTEAVSFLTCWWLRNSCKGKAVVMAAEGMIDLLMNMIGQEKHQKTSLKNIFLKLFGSLHITLPAFWHLDLMHSNSFSSSDFYSFLIGFRFDAQQQCGNICVHQELNKQKFIFLIFYLCT